MLSSFKFQNREKRGRFSSEIKKPLVTERREEKFYSLNQKQLDLPLFNKTFFYIPKGDLSTFQSLKSRELTP